MVVPRTAYAISPLISIVTGAIPPAKVNVTAADLMPVDAATFIVSGSSKLWPGGMIFPCASIVVQVQVGVADWIVTGFVEELISRKLRVIVERGSINPNLINGGSTMIVAGKEAAAI